MPFESVFNQLLKKGQIFGHNPIKACANNKINVTQMVKLFENIVRKGEKMLVTCIPFFSHNVFKRLLSQGNLSSVESNKIVDQ